MILEWFRCPYLFVASSGQHVYGRSGQTDFFHFLPVKCKYLQRQKEEKTWADGFWFLLQFFFFFILRLLYNILHIYYIIICIIIDICYQKNQGSIPYKIEPTKAISFFWICAFNIFQCFYPRWVRRPRSESWPYHSLQTHRRHLTQLSFSFHTSQEGYSGNLCGA